MTGEDAERGGQTALERLGAAGADMAFLQPANPVVRRALQVGLVALVLGFLAAALASQWSKVGSFAWHFSPGWLAPSVACFLAFQASRAELWARLIGSLGYEIPHRRAWAIWCVSLLGRYVPTSALMAVGRTALAEREGVPKRVTLASIAYEIALAFGTAMMIAGYFIVALPGLRGAPERFAALALPVAALAFLHPAVFHRASDWALRRLGRQPLPVSLSLRQIVGYAAVYALALVVAGCGVYAFAKSIHPVAGADVPTVIGSYSVGYAAAVAGSVLPAGLGARETALATALAAALPLTVAIAVSVAVRLIQTAIEILYATTTPLLARRDERRR